MATCTFFGHSDTSDTIAPMLQQEIVALIEQHGVTRFYVGNHGNFDRIVVHMLQRLQAIYPHIRYTVVLAYSPTVPGTYPTENTLYPEEMACVPKRFAIDRRNRWMLKNSKFVITHVQAPTGGAAKFKAVAEKQQKTVINLV